MIEGMKYLTPKKPLSAIARERAEQAETQNIDVYEAIAGLYEEMASLVEQNAALEERVNQLEGRTK
ncbi:MAG: transcription factor [Acutalibacter sp.]|jgi:cell division protein FtsB